MGCTFGLDMYIGTLCIGEGNCDKASSITQVNGPVTKNLARLSSLYTCSV